MKILVVHAGMVLPDDFDGTHVDALHLLVEHKHISKGAKLAVSSLSCFPIEIQTEGQPLGAAVEKLTEKTKQDTNHERLTGCISICEIHEEYDEYRIGIFISGESPDLTPVDCTIEILERKSRSPKTKQIWDRMTGE